MSLSAGATYHLLVVGTIVGNEEVYNIAMATVKCDFSDLQVAIDSPMQVRQASLPSAKQQEGFWRAWEL
jgi:hypothetical protein